MSFLLGPGAGASRPSTVQRVEGVANPLRFNSDVIRYAAEVPKP